MRNPLRRRLYLAAARDLTIGHLLVVAGPSGSGKSTFLRMLANESLPPDIVAALPPGASGWPHTSGSHVQRRQSPAKAGAPVRFEGLVLHYDFMRTFDTPLADYSGDPALSVLANAERLSLVTIRPSIEALLAQVSRKGKSNTAMRKLGRKARRYVRSFIRSQPPNWRTAERHGRLAGHYENPAFLPSWYARWETYFTTQAGPRLARQVLVEPSGPDGGVGFRLADETAVPRPA